MQGLQTIGSILGNKIGGLRATGTSVSSLPSGFVVSLGRVSSAKISSMRNDLCSIFLGWRFQESSHSVSLELGRLSCWRVLSSLWSFLHSLNVIPVTYRLNHTLFVNSITIPPCDWQCQRQLVSNLLLMKADEGWINAKVEQSRLN